MLIDLYRIVEGSRIWTVTSSDSEVIHNGEIYLPETISRSNIQTKAELSKEKLNVTVSTRSEFGFRWVNVVTDLPITITVFEKNDAIVNVAWKGRFVTKKPNGLKIVLIFESIFTSIKRPGLRARFQKSCRFVVYNRGCNLNFHDFEVFGTPTTINGSVIDIPEAGLESDGFYNGGLVSAPDGSFGYIISHVGTIITMQRPIDSLTYDNNNNGYGNNYGNIYGGLVISIIPGCDKLRDTCRLKFDNLDNYGGYSWIPGRNPIDGSSIV